MKIAPDILWSTALAMLLAMLVSASAGAEPGDVRWRAAFDHPVVAAGVVVATGADGEASLFVVGDLGGIVRGLEAATGKRIWEKRISENEGVRAAPVPLAGRDAIAFALPSGRVVALRSVTGEVLWETDLGVCTSAVACQQVIASPAVSSSGRVIVGTRSGRLYALDGRKNGSVTGEGSAAGPILHSVVATLGGTIVSTQQNVKKSLSTYDESFVETSGGSIKFDRLPSAAPVIDNEERLIYASGNFVFVRSPFGEPVALPTKIRGKAIGLSLSQDGSVAWVVASSPGGNYWLKPYGLDGAGGIGG